MWGGKVTMPTTEKSTLKGLKEEEKENNPKKHRKSHGDNKICHSTEILFITLYE